MLALARLPEQVILTGLTSYFFALLILEYVSKPVMIALRLTVMYVARPATSDVSKPWCGMNGFKLSASLVRLSFSALVRSSSRISVLGSLSDSSKYAF